MSTSHQTGALAGAWPVVALGGIVAGAVGAFATHNLWASLACMALGAGGIMLLADRAARQQAEDEAYAAWVEARGWEPVRNLPAALVTSLLRCGDARRLEDGYVGLLDGRTAAVGHFVWETVTQEVDDYGNVHETRVPHDHTVLETLTGLQSMVRLTLAPRGFGEGRIADSLESLMTTDRAVELESAELREAYRLFVADQESELVVRDVFTPSLIVRLVELADAGITVEFETGALVCSVRGRSGDPGLLDALAEISAAVADALCAASITPSQAQAS